MTNLKHVWTNGMDSKIFTTYPEVVDYKRVHGGSFRAIYVENKDIDYVAPNPNRKSYAKRLVAC